MVAAAINAAPLTPDASSAYTEAALVGQYHVAQRKLAELRAARRFNAYGARVRREQQQQLEQQAERIAELIAVVDSKRCAAELLSAKDALHRLTEENAKLKASNAKLARRVELAREAARAETAAEYEAECDDLRCQVSELFCRIGLSQRRLTQQISARIADAAKLCECRAEVEALRARLAEAEAAHKRGMEAHSSKVAEREAKLQARIRQLVSERDCALGQEEAFEF